MKTLIENWSKFLNEDDQEKSDEDLIELFKNEATQWQKDIASDWAAGELDFIRNSWYPGYLEVIVGPGHGSYEPDPDPDDEGYPVGNDEWGF